MKKRSYRVLLLTMLVFVLSTTLAFAAEIDSATVNSEKFGLLTLIPPIVAIVLVVLEMLFLAVVLILNNIDEFIEWLEKRLEKKNKR